MKIFLHFLFQKIQVYVALMHNFLILSSGPVCKTIFLSLQRQKRQKMQ